MAEEKVTQFGWGGIPTSFTGVAQLPSGTKMHMVRGVAHRVGAPAVEGRSGLLEYCEYGVLHNEEGPAVIYPDGSVDYYLNGKRYTKEVHSMKTKKASSKVLMDEMPAISTDAMSRKKLESLVENLWELATSGVPCTDIMLCSCGNYCAEGFLCPYCE